MFTNFQHAKFHVLGANGSLVIAVKLKAKQSHHDDDEDDDWTRGDCER
jgi:hypothetical protein